MIYFCIPVPYNEKNICLGCYKLLYVFIDPFNFIFFSITSWGIDLDYFDTEWFVLEMNRDHSIILEIAPKYCILESFIDYEGYSMSSKGFLPTVVDIRSSSPIPVYFSSLIPKMSMSCHLMFDHFQFPLIHRPNIPSSYAMLFFTALYFTSITSHIWLFLLWLHLFILSGFVSSLFSSSILGTYQPREFIFQCPIFLPFHTFHGVLKGRILKRCAIPLFSGPHFLRTFHHDPSIMGGPTQHVSRFH